MNFKKALLTLPLLALSVAPALQAAGPHGTRSAAPGGKSCRVASPTRLLSTTARGTTSTTIATAIRIILRTRGNAYKSPAVQQMDRNHDGVVTARERERFYQSHGYRPY